MLMEETNMSPRQSMYLEYAIIAREHFDHLTKLGVWGKSSRDKHYNNGMTRERHVILRSALITVVFTALAVEAYIYDYGARNISDSFIDKYVDKLDIASKWVIVPQLITGREFPRGCKGYELLRNLISTRNSIIHHKSYDVDEKNGDRFDKFEENLIDTAKEAITTLRELTRAIDKIDPHEKAEIWFSPILCD